MNTTHKLLAILLCFAFQLCADAQSLLTPNLAIQQPRTDSLSKVAVSGNRVVASEVSSGGVFVYDLGSPSPSSPAHALLEPENEGSSFSQVDSVAIDGSQVVVGVPQSKSVHVYNLGSANPNVPVITLPAPTSSYSFGRSIAISGNRIVVGGSNRAYVFDLSSNTPVVPVAVFESPRPDQYGSFGIAVAISGDKVVVGGNYTNTGASFDGMAFVYDLGRENRTDPAAELLNPTPSDYDHFGSCVAISGDRIVVTCPNGAKSPLEAGAAYVYQWTGAERLPPTRTLKKPNAAVGDGFGISCSIAGNFVAIGSLNVVTWERFTEEAHVFDLGTTNPEVPVAILKHPNTPSNDSFGISIGVSDQTVVVGAPGQYDYSGRKKPCVYAYGIQDSGTSAPSLFAPWPKALFGDSIPVDFYLPENAQPGSVQLVFNDGTERALTLALESRGRHQFSFSPSNPTRSPAVASGSALPDGNYSATLRYRDAAGNPAASSLTIPGVSVDLTPPRISVPPNGFAPLTFFTPATMPDFAAQATLDGAKTIVQSPPQGSVLKLGSVKVTLSACDNAGNEATVGFTINVFPPKIIEPHGGFAPLTFLTPATMPDFASQAAVEAGVNLEQAPPPGSPLPVGPVTVTLTARDAEGNARTIELHLTVKWQNPGFSTVVTSGSHVGSEDVAPNAVWLGFGIPSLLDADGTVGFLGRYRKGGATVNGIFRQRPEAKPELVREGFASIAEPAFFGMSVALKSNGELWLLPNNAQPRLLAKEGGTAPGTHGEIFDAITAFAIVGEEAVFFTATLKGSKRTNATVWSSSPTTRLIWREGSPLDIDGVRTPLESLKTLFAVPGSGGHGRTSAGTIQTMATYPGGRTQSLTLTPTGARHETVLGPFRGLAVIGTGIADKSGGTTYLAKLEHGIGGIGKLDDTTIIHDGVPIVRAAGATGVPGEVFRSFMDPVSGTDSEGRKVVAFAAAITGPGVRANSNTGIWQFNAATKRMQPIAREGAEAPGGGGALFTRFNSLAVLPQRGAIFTATLSRSNRAGLWGMDSSGTLRKLLREGDALGDGRHIQKIHVLTTVPGSGAQTRSFSPNPARVPEIAVRIALEDGSEEIIRIAVP